MPNGHSNSRLYTAAEIMCIKCRTMKPYTEYHKDTNKYGVAYYCKECANKNGRKHHTLRQADAKYKEAKRSSDMNVAHGLSLEQYIEKLRAQGSFCAICWMELPESGPLTHLDHCHKTGKLRAFLCTNCNRGLGHFQDSEALLLRAADYLKSHNTNVVREKEV